MTLRSRLQKLEQERRRHLDALEAERQRRWRGLRPRLDWRNLTLPLDRLADDDFTPTNWLAFRREVDGKAIEPPRDVLEEATLARRAGRPGPGDAELDAAFWKELAAVMAEGPSAPAGLPLGEARK